MTSAPSSGRLGLHQPSGRLGLGLALALTTVALWSILPVGLKVALGGLDPLTLTWVRFLCAALFLGSLLRLRGSLPKPTTFSRREWTLMTVAGLGLAGNYGFFALGLDYTNAGTTQVVIQIAPMLLTLGGIYLFRETFVARQWLGFAILVTGLGLFSSEQIAQLASDIGRYYVGLGFLVVAAVTWASYGLAQKQLLEHMGPPQIMVCLYATGALVFSPLASPSQLLELSGVQMAALIFCVANMLLSYASFSEALAHLEASRVSAMLAVIPLGTLAAIHSASWVAPSVFEPEPITAMGVLGAVLVVSGSLTTTLGRR